MKYHTVYLMVRVAVQSESGSLGEVTQELENQSRLVLADTPKVRILETEILLTRVRNPKNIHHGTSSQL